MLCIDGNYGQHSGHLLLSVLFQDQALLNHVHQSLAALRDVQDPRDLDAEAFYRLVLTARGVAVARPYNLAKFADQQHDKTPVSEETQGQYSHETKRSSREAPVCCNNIPD